ncbi:holin, partial [Escherichia coli]|nr:holin [Escherichia coli]EEW6002577.1 holin [Escherichia coli]
MVLFIYRRINMSEPLSGSSTA